MDEGHERGAVESATGLLDLIFVVLAVVMVLLVFL
jgi:hypothetical protein